MATRRRRVEGELSPRGDNPEPAQVQASGEPPPAPKPAPAAAASQPDEPVSGVFPAPWGQVVNDILRIDVATAYKRLTDELTLGEATAEYGVVIRAVDNAGRNFYDAIRLSRAAKIADLKFTAEMDRQLEVMRSTAREQLESEKAALKASGGSVKAPTIQEIQDRVIANWGDQWQSIEQRKAEMHGTFRSLEGLKDAWNERGRHLNRIADGFVGRKV